MNQKWKCQNCGSINPANKSSCLACNSPYIPPEEIQRQADEIERQDSERIITSIQAKTSSKTLPKWEYCFLLTDNGAGSGLVIFLTDGETIDLGKAAFGVAIAELGFQGWELVDGFVITDLQSQYPTQDLRPTWSYMLDAALNQPRREGVFAYESIREANGMLFIFKRTME